MTIKNAPEAPRDETADDYHGERIADPYRPLEDLDAEPTKAWIQAQQERTEDFLLPQEEVMKTTEQFYADLWNYERQSMDYRRGDRSFFSFAADPDSFAVIKVREADGTERTVLDPNLFSADRTVSLASWSPSPDGRYIAFQTQTKGTDWSELKVLDVTTGQVLPDRFPPLRRGGVSWQPDSQGFYYQKPRASAAQIKAGGDPDDAIFDHRLHSDGAQDALYFEPPAAWKSSDKEHLHVGLAVDTETGDQFLYTSHGTAEENGLYWKNAVGEWVEILPSRTAQISLVRGEDGFFYGVTTLHAPRGRVVRVDPKNPQPENWQTIVPEHPRDVISNVFEIRGRLFVTSQRDIADRMEIYDTHGQKLKDVPLPPMTSIGYAAPRRQDEDFFLSFTSYRSPGETYRYDLATDTLAFVRKANISRDMTSDNFVIEQRFVTSPDGTQVPITVMYDKTKMRGDGTNATMLYGYGGFGISLSPGWRSDAMHWVSQGGVFAVANIRGGSEYGEEWHRAAVKGQKQKSYDDFIACAEYLQTEGFTSPERLAISGGSNGGLLTTACMIQRPELFGAVIADVPVTDMLRFPKATSGPYWVSDYGDPEDPQDYKSLRAISPLHNIKEGQHYPPHLVFTADHDDRVVPWHSYKFVATMQEKASEDTQSYLYVQRNAGHGAGMSMAQMRERFSVQQAFLAQSLGPIDPEAYLEWREKNGAVPKRNGDCSQRVAAAGCAL